MKNKERERKNACEKIKTRSLRLLHDELGEQCHAVMFAMKAGAQHARL